MTRPAVARAARRDLTINQAEEKLRTRKPSEPGKRFPPPDKPRKKNHGIGATKIAAIRQTNAHLREGCSRGQIHFRCEPVRLEWRQTKAAPGPSGSEPTGQVPAKLTFAVVENPAANRVKFGRTGSLCGLKSHTRFSALDLTYAEEFECLVPQLGQS